MPADAFIHPLLQRLASIADVLRSEPPALGLLALGSVGAQTSRLDAWSDLDFFVIVEPAAKAAFIGDLGWLQRAHPLAWAFQNTVDGHKALMADGVLCEFAVFAPDELRRATYAPGRWVWRRDDRVDAALERPAMPLPQRRDTAWLLGEALSNLVVGLGRHARGERLAAMRMVQVYALDRVLELAALAPPDTAGTCGVVGDPFNPDRRVETRLPLLAADLPVLAGGYGGTVAAARALLAWLTRRYTVPPAVATHIEGLLRDCEQAPVPHQ